MPLFAGGLRMALVGRSGWPFALVAITLLADHLHPVAVILLYM
jgi:hypothetical protein